MKKYLFLLLFNVLSQITFGQRIYSVVFDNLPQDNQLYPRTDKNEAIVALPTPTLEFTNITFNSVTIAWKSVVGATKFALERDNLDSGLGFKFLANFTGSELAFIDKDLSPKTKYNYRIRAENLNLISDYSTNSIETLALLTKPELSSTVLYCNSLKINWKLVVGATSYKLERKLGNSEYKHDLKSTELIDKDLVENTTYSYRLKAFGDKTESLETVISVQTPAILTAPEITAETVTHERIKLLWKAIPTANRYVLER